jgi:hypothetical protein
MMSLRFFGKKWDNPSPEDRKFIAHFVSHEVFHYWNSGLIHSTAPNWLHEGSADYAAWLAARSTGKIDEAEFTAHVQKAERQCKTLLAGAALDSPAAQKGFAPYACGAVMQARTKDFFGTWRTLLAETMTRPERTYDAEDFRRAAGLPDLDPGLQ